MTIITETGEYRAEDGTKHEVKYIDKDYAYGRNVKGGTALWNVETGKVDAALPPSWRLIGKWSDPIKPAAGWVLRKSIDPNRPSDSPEYIFVRQVVDEKELASIKG